MNSESEPGDGVGDEARFRRGLLGLAVLGGLSQFFIQSQAFSVNPMVLVPQVDAATIWEHAGEIASGRLVDDQPYDTAPLILYVAGAVRALGGGLVAWGVLQSLLHVVTALLIALATRGFASRSAVAGFKGGAGAGLLAGGLFLLLDEPAASTSRVLSATLQLFLASVLLYLLRPCDSATEERQEGFPAPRGSALVGLVLGLFCLAYPPMLAGIPLYGAWAFLASGKSARSALALVGAAALAILPATIHNVKASGEWIPISAQAGLTFYHGNNASADGTISPVGVVNNKGEQALDSLQQARAELGDSASWKGASRYWMDKGLDWWAEEPGAAARLALVKLWYAVSGQRYGDVYQPWREREDGAASRLWLAPLPLAWLMPLALVALFGLLRDRSTRMAAVPLFVLVAVPIAVVVAFFYTPRYRLPCAAAVVPLVAILVARLSSGGGSSQAKRGAVLAGIALLIGVSSGFFNRLVGFDVDPTGSHELRFLERMAAASGQVDRHGDGARYLEKILDRDPDSAEARGRLLDLTWYLAASRDPTVFEPHAALEVAERLVAGFGPAPGLLDLRGTARAGLGDFAGALTDLDAALAGLEPADPSRTEIEQRRALFAAGRKFELPSLIE